MPIPLGVYVAVAAGVGTGGVAAYFAKKADGTVEEVTKDVFDELVEQGVPLLEELAGQIGALSLQFVEGLGSAVITGIDNAYDAIREKLRGKEPDVIAALTIGFATVFTVVYLYQSFKNTNDAFG